MAKLIFFCALLTSVFAQAEFGIANSTQINNYSTSGAGVLVVTVKDEAKGSPSCATKKNRFALKTTSPGFHAVRSTVQSAHLANKKVKIVGTGKCDARGGVETINYVVVY